MNLRKAPQPVLINGNQSHTHSEEDGEFVRRRAILQMKDEVLNRPDLSCKEVYKAVLGESHDIFEADHSVAEVAAAMPTFENMRSVLHRHRTTVRPALPSSRDEIELEGIWTETKRGGRFLQFDDSGTAVNPKPRILGFSSDRDMEILLGADVIFMDGTFRVVPR